MCFTTFPELPELEKMHKAFKPRKEACGKKRRTATIMHTNIEGSHSQERGCIIFGLFFWSNEDDSYTETTAEAAAWKLNGLPVFLFSGECLLRCLLRHEHPKLVIIPSKKKAPSLRSLGYLSHCSWHSCVMAWRRRLRRLNTDTGYCHFEPSFRTFLLLNKRGIFQKLKYNACSS